MGRNVYALIEKHVAETPEKCKDLGTFNIPCTIGNKWYNLRASINAMLLSVFISFSLGPFKTISVVIQLANGNTIHLARLMEDVLVQVDNLIFLQSFTY